MGWLNWAVSTLCSQMPGYFRQPTKTSTTLRATSTRSTSYSTACITPSKRRCRTWLSTGMGGAIVITSSTAGLNALCPRYSVRSHGLAGYQAAKHGVVGLMRYYASSLAEKNIRVNTVHPTGVATPMLMNDYVERYFGEHPEALPALQNLLPVEMVDAADISEAMIYLCGQSGRYITGISLPVDAGLGVRK